MINAIIAAKKVDEEKVGDTPNVLNKQYHQFGDVQIGANFANSVY